MSVDTWHLAPTLSSFVLADPRARADSSSTASLAPFPKRRVSILCSRSAIRSSSML